MKRNFVQNRSLHMKNEIFSEIKVKLPIADMIHTFGFVPSCLRHAVINIGYFHFNFRNIIISENNIIPQISILLVFIYFLDSFLFELNSHGIVPKLRYKHMNHIICLLIFKIPRRFLQISRRFLQVSRRFLQISQWFLKISRRFLQFSRRFLKLSRRFLQISRRFLQISRRFLKISRRFLRFPNGFLRFPNGFLRFPNDFLRFPDSFFRFPDGFLRFPEGFFIFPDGFKDIQTVS